MHEETNADSWPSETTDADEGAPHTTYATEEQLAARAALGHLLVVDDNAMGRDVLLQRLIRQGHKVAAVDSGIKALEALRREPFDLVLLDIMMPDMDGYEVLQYIKSDKALCQIPVIMVSALDDRASVVRCIEMGADDYLVKPIDTVMLKARIGACLEKKRAHDREMQLHELLKQSYKRLQSLEKLRDGLTLMIVQDLRVPIESALAGVQSVEASGELSSGRRDVLQTADNSLQALLGMVNDLLHVNKLEAGSAQLDYTVLSAADLIDEAVRQVTPQAANEDVRLFYKSASGLPPFQGDKNKLVRVLVNLLTNAIAFSPKGEVTVEAGYSKNGTEVEFIVTDSGIGIPQHRLDGLFDKFGQVESRHSGSMMSTGLGLTFSKLAVEAHRGLISVKSTPGEGSKFSFTIPLLSSFVPS